MRCIREGKKKEGKERRSEGVNLKNKCQGNSDRPFVTEFDRGRLSCFGKLAAAWGEPISPT